MPESEISNFVKIWLDVKTRMQNKDI